MDCRTSVNLSDFESHRCFWRCELGHLPERQSHEDETVACSMGSACKCTNETVGIVIEPDCLTLIIDGQWYPIRSKPLVSRRRLKQKYQQRANVKTREFEVSWQFENDWEDAHWSIKLDEDEIDYSFSCFVLHTMLTHLYFSQPPSIVTES